MTDPTEALARDSLPLLRWVLPEGYVFDGARRLYEDGQPTDRWEIRAVRPIEQAAEAADREAAPDTGEGQASNTRGVSPTSAAADLDVDALATAYVDCRTLTIDKFTEKYPASLTGRFWIDLAAYAAAKRDPSAPADPTGGGIVTPRTKAGRALLDLAARDGGWHEIDGRRDEYERQIDAIEREAAAAERERLERKLRIRLMGESDPCRQSGLRDATAILAEPSDDPLRSVTQGGIGGRSGEIGLPND